MQNEIQYQCPHSKPFPGFRAGFLRLPLDVRRDAVFQMFEHCHSEKKYTHKLSSAGAYVNL